MKNRAIAIVIIMVYLLTGNTLYANAAGYYKTPDQAIQWCLSKVGQSVESDGVR